MSEKILVTGGCGFLGSALVKRLVQEGYDVVVYDDCSRGSAKRIKSVIKNLNFIEGDIRDFDKLESVIKKCNSVFHLAFINGTKYFYEKPDLVLDVGISGALNILKLSKKYEIETFINASSSEIYQQPNNIPTPETERAIIPDVLNPRFSYSGAKLISELLSINLLRNEKTRDVIFRPHNVFGPEMGFEHVIPELMKKLFLSSNKWTNNQVEINIQGNGSETRAFCYIDDAVDQIMTIFKNGLKGEIYNIGIENEMSIKQLINHISKILNIKITVKETSLQTGGTTRRCPDISKIKSIGYLPNDNFLTGLENTLNWYKKIFHKL